jgi:hypothetical protein
VNRASLGKVYRVAGITYERDAGGAWTAVVRHEFYGATLEEALAVKRAHLRTDAFLRACERGSFEGGIVCRTHWFDPDEVPAP